jgi:hypothetical protein
MLILIRGYLMFWKIVLRATMTLCVVGMFIYTLDYMGEVQEDTQMCFDKVAARFSQSDKVDAAILNQLRELSKQKVRAADPVNISGKADWPIAIMGWDFGDRVEGFKPGQHYVLKVFSVDGGEVAFGFSRIDTEDEPDA